MSTYVFAASLARPVKAMVMGFGSSCSSSATAVFAMSQKFQEPMSTLTESTFITAALEVEHR